MPLATLTKRKELHGFLFLCIRVVPFSIIMGLRLAALRAAEAPLQMVQIFSCYPSGTVLLRTKAICSKRMRRLISISVNYMLDKRYSPCTQLYTNVKCFPCGRTQHTRRMRFSNVSMIQSVLESRFMRAIPHYPLNG